MNEKIIKEYKKLNDFDVENLEDYLGLKYIYNIDNKISDKIASTILEFSRDAWLKEDGSSHSLGDYTFFLTKALYDGDLKLDILEQSNKWDIIQAINDENPNIITNRVLERCKETSDEYGL